MTSSTASEPSTLWKRVGAELHVSPQQAKLWGHAWLYRAALDPWIVHFLRPAMEHHFRIFPPIAPQTHTETLR